MAEFAEKTSLYEVVVRVREDGTYAAHYQNITRILRDGEVVSASEGPLVPLTDGSTEAYAVLRAIVGDASAETLAANQLLLAEAQALRDQITSLEAQLEQLQVAQ